MRLRSPGSPGCSGTATSWESYSRGDRPQGRAGGQPPEQADDEPDYASSQAQEPEAAADPAGRGLELHGCPEDDAGELLGLAWGRAPLAVVVGQRRGRVPHRRPLLPQVL